MKKSIAIIAASVLFAAGIAGMGGIGSVNAAGEAQKYDTYTNVPAPTSGLVIEPTRIVEPASEAELEALAASETHPTSVILTVNEKMEVVFGSAKKSLAEVFDASIKGVMIPVIRLTAATADPFLTWLKETYTVKDIMAVSEDIEVLAKLYADETGFLVNTVYDLTKTKLSSDRYAEWPHVAAANKAGCNILMYDAGDANLSVAAEYVEALTKVCWAYADTMSEAAGAIAAGCYGVVSKNAAHLTEALALFGESGYARAQYIAAHRGITKYANEQSLTGIMASYNEGATHAEIDIQITSDEVLLINHDSDSNKATGTKKTFVNSTAEEMQSLKYNIYSSKYGDTFPTLDETVRQMQKTDVILIVELKIDNGSARAVDELHAIENLKKVMDRYPAFAGHWYTITFYAPYAQKMREILPEIPVGFLGANASGKENAEKAKPWGGLHKNMTDVGGKIAFLRTFNVGLDESMSGNTNSTAENYLARGYTQNTWTFTNLNNFTYKVNVATTNTAEDCAMLVKEISNEPIKLSEAAMSAGKAQFKCLSYNGWATDRECSFVVLSREGKNAVVIPYCSETSNPAYGLYGSPTKVTIA